MRFSGLFLKPLAAAVTVATTLVLAASAFAGSASDFRYEAYLAKEAKMQTTHKMAAKSEQKAIVGTSEVNANADGKSSAGNGGRRYLYEVAPEQEQLYRGN